MGRGQLLGLEAGQRLAKGGWVIAVGHCHCFVGIHKRERPF